MNAARRRNATNCQERAINVRESTAAGAAVSSAVPVEDNHLAEEHSIWPPRIASFGLGTQGTDDADGDKMIATLRAAALQVGVDPDRAVEHFLGRRGV